MSLWLVLSATASALTLVPANLSDITRGSRLIVHGRVVDVRSQMTAGRRSIESVVTVAVIDTVKGEAASVISFRIPAGQVGRYRRVMPGVPAFAAGDEVVVFLTGRAPALPVPFGLSEGVYRVRAGDAAQRAAVVAALEQRVRVAMERTR